MMALARYKSCIYATKLGKLPCKGSVWSESVSHACFCVDWSDVNPLDYLEPFLGVVTSQETSGPITGTALNSLCRFFDHYIIGRLP